MKKKQTLRSFPRGSLSKFLLKMKLLTFFMFATFVVSAVNSYSQSAKFNLSMDNVSVKEVFECIEENSEFILLYNEKWLDVTRRVDVNVKNESVEKVLEQVFNGTNNVYHIYDRQIVVLEDENKVNLDRNEGKMLSPKKSKGNLLIQGRVLDTNEPPGFIPGATIIIKDKSTGTVTDEGGYFKIYADEGDVLEISFIGFQKEEFLVKRSISNFSIALKEDVRKLDEVVVTGYSEERKLNMVSSIASLDVSSQLQHKPITSMSQALQGGITGINVTQNSGLPGADAAEIKIRGISTLGHSDPLVLVDGIPMDMNNLDPNTIQSVTVLKDAAAAAIYGARAANGVIVVKTKRGKAGKVNVSYNTYYGTQKATYLPNFVDGATYMDMVNEAYVNIGGDPIYSKETILNTKNGTDPIKYPSTNWKDFIYQDGAIQSHSISVSGGNTVARFALSVNYQDQKGLMEKTDFNRLSIRANTSVNLRDNLTVNMDFNSYRRERNEAMYRNNQYSSVILNYMFYTPPNVIPTYPSKEGIDQVFYGNVLEMRNPAAMIDRGGKYNNLEDNVSINIQPQWNIVDNLTLKGQYSYRVSSSAWKEMRDAYNFFDYDSGVLLYTWDAQNRAGQGRSSYYYLGSTLEYILESGFHRLFSIVGYNQELTNSGDWDQWSLRSFFAKFNYTYKSKYLVEATLRADGSSRFDEGEKYGYFPSVALGWNLHEEELIKSLGKVQNFKLRASYGQLGNENIGLYKYQSLINSGNGVETVFGNPDITWETVNMLNLGTDITVFKNIDFSFDLYDKLTKNMIITPPISMIGGINAAPLNSGEVRNTGWELDANYRNSFGKLFYNLHVGLSHNKNKIESLFGGPYDNGETINKEGYPLYSHYKYKTDGLLQKSDFIGEENGVWIPKEGVTIFDGQQPGDIKYIDQDNDNKITPDDRVIMGNGEPDFNYFFNISMKYKNWDFEILMQGVEGVDAYYSSTYANGLSVEGDGSTPLVEQLDYWSSNNIDARYPRLAPTAGYGRNNEGSDFWLFDASYLRCKYIQIGHNFNYKAIRNIGISSFRVYLNAQNPFTFSTDKLVDPENRGGVSSYPLLKTYSAGLSVTF